MRELIKSRIRESIEVKQTLLSDDELIRLIEQVAQACINAFRSGKKVLLCGNGGSAADAQHIAAELSGRFIKDRDPLFAEALHVNTSFTSAVANDYGYKEVYARAVKAMGVKGDVLIAISTSGNSENVIHAVQAAHKSEMIVVGLTGQTGGKLAELCDYPICAPADDTARIQEMHITIGHILCELIENALFGQ